MLRLEAQRHVLIAAHRGGYESDKADQAPENSLANIQVCQSKGYPLYETDIQRTKDGHFVIMHDRTIDRETTGTGVVSEMMLADLKGLHQRYRDGSVSEEGVATLEEFLEQGKGRTVFKADLKPGVSAHFPAIMKQVVELGALDGIIFRLPYSEAARFEAYKAGGVPYTKSLLMFKVSSKKQLDDIQARFDPLFIQINLSKKDPSATDTLALIRYASSRGLLVETHADGTAEDWAKLVDAGVRMFHSSKPSLVQAFLHGRSKAQ
jgi:glycerophosphoryl diester phosphodiesterase